MMNTPRIVCVTGAAGQIAYSLLPHIVNGSIFGRNVQVKLHLLDIPQMLETLNGVKMELEDCALGTLVDIVITADPMVAFKDCDYAFMLGAMPRREGMERKDLLKANVGIFKLQGEALDMVAKKSVKIVVVGNPANTNALALAHYAPSLPRQNISALTRLDQNRAVAMLAAKIGTPSNRVKNVIIWGNHSNTQFPDISHASIDNIQSDMIAAIGSTFYTENFIPDVQKRGGAVIAARKLSSAMSAAKAIADHMHDWVNGIPEGQFVSMAMCSDGSYGVPEGLFFSFPMKYSQREMTWSIASGLPMSQCAQQMMEKTTAELISERDEALTFLKG